MGIFTDVVQMITNNLFSQVSVLIGLIALIGLILQRKPFEEVVAGALRATIGVVVLNIGVDIFTGGLTSFQAIVSSALGVEPPKASSSLSEFSAGAGSVVPLIIAGGFIVHMVIVRIFPAARYVYLTGHLMYWMSVVIAASLVEAFGDVNRWVLAGSGSIIIGCYWVIQPLVIAPLMRKVMGDDQVGLAHTDSSIGLIAGYGAKALRLGDPKKHDSENLKLPRALSFFKDITVSTAFITGVIMLVAISFADSSVVKEQMAGSAVLPWVWALLQALRFAGGIAVLLFGVRMFLAEIVPAFKGLSERWLPGAKPALDIPVTFTRAPTAVMLGFICATVVFLVFMGVFAATGVFVLVPPMIMLFFGGAAGGVFGNAVAGWRGAVFGGAVAGILLAVGQWISWGLYASTAPEIATLADPDWFAVGWFVRGLGTVLAPLGTAAVWIVAAVVLVATVTTLSLLRRRALADDAAALVAEAEADAETRGDGPLGAGAPVPARAVTSPDPSGSGMALGGEAAGAAAPALAGSETSAARTALATRIAEARPAPLRVLAVCGAGMGTSLILRTTAERAFKKLGVEATLSHTDVGSARGQRPDVVIAQPTYLSELTGIAPVMVPITSFVDVSHVEGRLRLALEEQQWL